MEDKTREVMDAVETAVKSAMGGDKPLPKIMTPEEFAEEFDLYGANKMSGSQQILFRQILDGEVVINSEKMLTAVREWDRFRQGVQAILKYTEFQ